MAVSDASNPLDEIVALAANMRLAVAGAIPRPVTVLSDPYDDLYGGTYPLIMPETVDWRLDRLQGGNTGTKGQRGTQPSIYGWTLQDVINQRPAPGEEGTQVANARNDLFILVRAIAAWFDVAAHRGLPVGAAFGATLAGEHLRMRYRGLFAPEDAGEIRIVVGLEISVVGIVHQGTLT